MARFQPDYMLRLGPKDDYNYRIGCDTDVPINSRRVDTMSSNVRIKRFRYTAYNGSTYSAIKFYGSKHTALHLTSVLCKNFSHHKENGKWQILCLHLLECQDVQIEVQGYKNIIKILFREISEAEEDTERMPVEEAQRVFKSTNVHSK